MEETSNTNTTPRHLQNDACYVCGGEDHGATFTETGSGHNYWSNADARAYFKAEATRSQYDGSVEAAFVAEHIPEAVSR